MSISEIFNQLPSNPYIYCFTIIAAIISVILAYRSVPKKTIKCIEKNITLITNRQSQFSKLDVLYDKQNVESLTITKVTFWNASFPTINSSDLIEKDPFSITIRDGEILDLSVLEGEDTSNQIKIHNIDNCTAEISFDYLDRKDGGMVQIIHTGKEDSIKISEKIKGGKIINVKDVKIDSYFEILVCIVILIFYFISNNDLGIFPESLYEVREITIIKQDYRLLIIVLFVVTFIIIYKLKKRILSGKLFLKNIKKRKK